MKKIIYLGMILSVLFFCGCGKDSAEDVVKDYVKNQFTLDTAGKIDTSNLTYTVTEDKESNTATVKVFGTLNYEEQIHLIKENGKWKISKGKIAKGKTKAAH
jgi:hypothetical protein